jgi:uncharacterized protein YkwD
MKTSMKTKLMLLSFALMSLVSFSSFTVKASGEPGKPATVAAAPSSLNKTMMLRLVNEVRKKGCQCGGTYYYPAPELLWSDQLEEAAVQHSNDMNRRNYFAHIAPDGSNAGVRIERTGYPWKIYGENIAEGYVSELDVLDGWLKSPGHCRNIMNPKFREMGVARTGDYWTQEFGTK